MISDLVPKIRSHRRVRRNANEAELSSDLAIAAIVIGCLLGCLIIFVIIARLCKHYRCCSKVPNKPKQIDSIFQAPKTKVATKVKESHLYDVYNKRNIQSTKHKKIQGEHTEYHKESDTNSAKDGVPVFSDGIIQNIPQKTNTFDKASGLEESQQKQVGFMVPITQKHQNKRLSIINEFEGGDGLLSSSYA